MLAKVDAYASEPHYSDHIQPVFDALPDRVRGGWERHGPNPVIVAGYKDILAVGERPIIFMEHGAGQTYGPGYAAYAGGRGRENVRLFLCPSERVADLNRAAWPGTPSVAIGCPKLDRYNGIEPEPGVVGFAFHWNANVCPESRSALSYYAEHLGPVAERYETIGTAHPRIARAAEKVYADAGIPWVDADEMFRRASVLVADNTSMGWEFMALDRPVLWLNAPWYRRTVSHGMRFWDMAYLTVNEPSDLVAGISVAMVDGYKTIRAEIADELYAHRNGTSAGRGAYEIVERF